MYCCTMEIPVQQSSCKSCPIYWHLLLQGKKVPHSIFETHLFNRKYVATSSVAIATSKQCIVVPWIPRQQWKFKIYLLYFKLSSAQNKMPYSIFKTHLLVKMHTWNTHLCIHTFSPSFRVHIIYICFLFFLSLSLSFFFFFFFLYVIF
jgi:hypothetical protein